MHKYFPIFFTACVLLFSCNSTPDAPQENTIVEPLKPVNPVSLLSKELKSGTQDNSLFEGLAFGVSKTDFTNKVATINEDIISIIDDGGWSTGKYWSVELLYLPTEVGSEPLVLDARNTTGENLDYVSAKPMMLLMSEATEEGTAEKSARENFVNRHLKLLKSKYGEPSYTTESYSIPKELGDISLHYHLGKGYYWITNNQMVVLVDVPLNYSIIYSGSPNQIPTPGQMMALANTGGKINGHNLWEIFFPTNPLKLFMLEDALEAAGFKVSKAKPFDKTYPELIAKGNSPYENLQFSLTPNGLYIKANRKTSGPLTEEQKNWNTALLDKIIDKQGKPTYSSKENGEYYWLYKGYITKYLQNDNAMELTYYAFF